MSEFPYGRAPFWLLVLACLSGVARLSWRPAPPEAGRELRFTIFARNHGAMYAPALGVFEARHGVRVRMQTVSVDVLNRQLQAAFRTGAPVPDVVELSSPAFGLFARGPVADVGFVDLTDRIRAGNLQQRMVASRFSLWSTRGRVFALPHDVHPVALCYRRDLVEALGIDVESLRTWEDFVDMGRRITRDLDGDGVPDRYALDLNPNGAETLEMLVRQRGGGYFDADGNAVFDSDIVTDTILWHLRQSQGADRIAYGAGWGQNLAKAMLDGLVLFYFCPDWRTTQFTMDVPSLAGKLALLPLPAWEPGGRRTSVWGGTGLAITRDCADPELAWAFAEFLYLEPGELGKRFRESNILPPVRDAWNLPEFDEPQPFFSGQAVGRLYADLAPETPDDYVHAYTGLAQAKVNEAYMAAAEHFRRHGERGLRRVVEAELARGAAYVRRVLERNVFLRGAA